MLGMSVEIFRNTIISVLLIGKLKDPNMEFALTEEDIKNILMVSFLTSSITHHQFIFPRRSVFHS